MNSRLLKLTCFLFMVMISWQYAKAADYTPATAFEYWIVGDKVTITKFIGSQTDVSIPPTINGKPVTAIGDSAFEHCISLKSITIPEGVTRINHSAFRYCISLATVTIPSSVGRIDNYAFEYCSSLTSITIPEGVASIGFCAFSYCVSLTSVTIPSNVYFIDWHAFEYCSNLVSVTMSEGIKTIGSQTFSDCTSLMSVKIPASVTTVTEYAFYRCSGLKELEFAGAPPSLGSNCYPKPITFRVPANMGWEEWTVPSGVTLVMESKPEYEYAISNNKVTITRYNGSATELAIPSYIDGKPVVSIGEKAFYACDKLSSVMIPSGVTSLGDSAFAGCTSLTAITIPASVTSVGIFIFHNCPSLAAINVDSANAQYSSVGGVLFNKSKTTLLRYPPARQATQYSIPAGVTSIGGDAFYGSMMLTSITIPSGVTAIGMSAFGGCSALTSMTIPSGVTTIGNGAFELCTSLASITVPPSVSEIGERAFRYCVNLTSIAIPSSVSSIKNETFCFCANLTSVTIPESVTEIGEGAFSDCSALTSIVLPQGLSAIEDEVFLNCKSLTSITIPEGVLEIGDEAFSYCYRLSSVTIPPSVEYIGRGAFSSCENLVDLEIGDVYGRVMIEEEAFSYCMNLRCVRIMSSWSEIGDGVFSECPELAVIMFNGESVPPVLGIDSYPTPITFCVLKNNQEGMEWDEWDEWEVPGDVTLVRDSEQDSADYIYTIENDEVTITGYNGSASVLMIPATIEGKPVVAIGDEAFSEQENLVVVTISEGVWLIEDGAFHGCLNLVSVLLPSSVEIISHGAFMECESLTSMTIPEGVTDIGWRIFDQCLSLVEVSFPASLCFFDDDPIGECPSLRAINVAPENAYYASVDGILFNKSMTALLKYPPARPNHEYSIPSSVTVIGSYAFYECYNLESITIPEGVTAICEHTFEECVNLTTVTIPEGVTSIGDEAFSGCYSLESITIPANVTSIGDSVFYDCSSLKSITISANVTTIGHGDFEHCNSLSSITIPSSVTSIGNYAFHGCTNLTEIEFEGAPPTFRINSYPKPITFYVPANMGWEEWTVPSGVTLVITPESDYTYTIDDGKVTITGYKGTATDIRIPSRIEGKPVVAIGYRAFYSNLSLTSVTIPSSVTSIGNYAFSQSSNLTSVTIPSSVTTIGNSAFYNCITLAKVTISEGVGSIGSSAFRATKLTEITIPASVTSIGSQAFSSNESLTSITVDAGNDYYVSVDGILFNKSMTTLVCYPANKQGTHYSIPTSVISIADGAFRRCRLLLSVTIPQGVTTIGSDAFVLCRVGPTIAIPASVTSIGDNALIFYDSLAEMEFMGAPPMFGSSSYPTPITFYVPANMGWEEWEAPSDVTLVILPDVQFQTVELDAGWNWAGFQVLPESHAVKDVLGTAGFTVNDVVQTVNGVARFTGANWIPSNFTIEYGCLYQIYTAHPVTLAIEGDTCEEDSMDVSTGWNWVSCPTLMTVRPEYLAHSGGWSAGDRIQASGGVSVTYTGSKWIPSTGFAMEPGKGYQIYTANAGTLSFGRPADSAQGLYAVVDLSDGPDAYQYPVRYTNTAPNLDDDTCRTTELWLRRIPAGTFIMGAPEGEVGRSDNETQREVTLTQDYYIGIFECTQRQWELVMGGNPSNFNNPAYYATRPVEYVSYTYIRGAQMGLGWPADGHAVDAASFMGRLQAKTGLVFDLPTEAQWEYACRAGTTTALNSGKNITSNNQDAAMDEVGRYWENGGSDYSEGCDPTYGTAKVGSYLPNAWGLYDMHGNVWEKCLDWYGDYGDAAVLDPGGADSGSHRVVRGGCWYNYAFRCRSAYRYDNYSQTSRSNRVGFRIALLP